MHVDSRIVVRIDSKKLSINYGTNRLMDRGSIEYVYTKISNGIRGASKVHTKTSIPSFLSNYNVAQ